MRAKNLFDERMATFERRADLTAVAKNFGIPTHLREAFEKEILALLKITASDAAFEATLTAWDIYVRPDDDESDD